MDTERKSIEEPRIDSYGQHDLIIETAFAGTVGTHASQVPD